MSARIFLVVCLTAIALPAAAVSNDPMVQKGPVITGVGTTDAWVTWSTTSKQGTGAVCKMIGVKNTAEPSLRIWPSGDADIYSDPMCGFIHRVHITGLSPDTRYSFILDQPYADGSAAAGTFTTPPETTNNRVSFVVYGDNREDIIPGALRSRHQSVADAILDHESDAALLVHTGDMAFNIPFVSAVDGGRQEFFDVERGLLSTRPIYTAIGNHELYDTADYDDMMNIAAEAGSSHPYYFSVDWGPAHIVFLDVFEGDRYLGGFGARQAGVTLEQSIWLDSDLQAAATRGQVLFAVMHQGPYSHGTGARVHGGSLAVQQDVLPLLLKWKVTATFAGHDHYYQRGQEGCINYIVSGAGGAPLYDPDNNAPGVIASAKQESYVVITVDGTTVTGLAKDTLGSILDSFTLAPSDGTPCGVLTGLTPPTLPADGARNGFNDPSADGSEAGANSAVAGQTDGGLSSGPFGCASTAASLGSLPALLAVALRRRRSRR